MNAVKADPSYADALVLQAKVALDLFDPLTAQTALERAAAAGVPKSRTSHLLGAMHWMQGDLAEAEEALASSTNPDANRIMARVQMDKGDFAAAQAAFDAALSATPEDSLVWTDIARLRFVTADQKGAIDAVDYALKLDPNNVRALEFRGRLMRSQFGMVAALPWFERGLADRADRCAVARRIWRDLGGGGALPRYA